MTNDGPPPDADGERRQWLRRWNRNRVILIVVAAVIALIVVFSLLAGPRLPEPAPAEGTRSSAADAAPIMGR